MALGAGAGVGDDHENSVRVIAEEWEMSETQVPPGLSVWDSDLFVHLTDHIRNEEAILTEYKDLCAQADSEYMEYLLELVIDEEARHHRLFSELAMALRASVEGDTGPKVPLVERVSNPQVLLEATERFLEAERTDERQLKHLAKTLRPMKGLSLWPLLIELMQRDNAKHQAILEFVRGQLRDPRRS